MTMLVITLLCSANAEVVQRHAAAALPDGMAMAAEEVQDLAQEADANVPSHPLLNVCILTADFWGLKSAGGTATAYHLLAAALTADINIKVD